MWPRFSVKSDVSEVRVLLNFLRNRLLIQQRKLVEVYSKYKLKKQTGLWSALQAYIEQSKSTGCSYTDYWALYSYVKKNKPTEILECGTGVSTLVLATALMELEKQGYEAGRVTSMDSSHEYLQMSKDLLPDYLKQYVDFCFSEVEDMVFSIFRGVGYSDIPKRSYDFVFVDGPDYKSEKDGAITFDADFINVLERSSSSVAAIIDKRVSTVFVLQQVLGEYRVKYNAVTNLGFVKPSFASDLITIDGKTPSLTFAKSFRAIAKTILKLSKV